MSVGHLARELEKNGIVTVIIAVQAFENMLKGLAPPRVLITPHPMGRPLGSPNDSKKQNYIIKRGLDLIEANEKGNIFTYIKESYLE